MFPRGGKLLTGDQSVLLAIVDKADRQKLIERLAAELHTDEKRKDSRSHVGEKLTRKRT